MKQYLSQIAFGAFVVAMTVLCLYLGVWQLNRAQEKSDLLAHVGSQTDLASLDLNVVVPDAESLHRRVVARGHFDSAHQLLLDNQVSEQRVGFQVLTPFIIDGSPSRAILVNRGWVAQGVSRAQLPAIAVEESVRQLHGKLFPAPDVGYRMGAAVGDATTWPRVAQYIDWDQLQPQMPYALMPFVVRLDANEPDGFERNWVVVEFGPERHTGYAVQWFGLAGVLVVLYLTTFTRKRRGKREF